MSVFSSSSPERYCLGGLMKDIDKDLSPREYDFDSKDETSYKTLGEQKLSLDSLYSLNSQKLLFSPSLENNIFFQNASKDNEIHSPSLFSIHSMLSSFNSQKSTIVLQNSLKEASKEELDNIIKEMSGYYSSIIKNKNGNYFCRDLLKACDKTQRKKILEELCVTMNEDCCDEFGSHPIQTLIELASSEEEYKLLLSSFNDMNKILKAALNSNGTFVIQKIFVHIPEKHRMELNLIFVKLLLILSMDMYGVCTVIKFINYTKNEVIEKLILNLILKNFVNIAENQYGNYLIQNIMENWWNSQKGLYLKKISMEKFHLLAINHYSSYVCDMLLKLSSVEDKKKIMTSLYNCKNINSIYASTSGKIIMNKLMNALKKSGNLPNNINKSSLKNIIKNINNYSKIDNKEDKKDN
jgi:hypothetical protein